MVWKNIMVLMNNTNKYKSKYWFGASVGNLKICIQGNYDSMKGFFFDILVYYLW